MKAHSSEMTLNKSNADVELTLFFHLYINCSCFEYLAETVTFCLMASVEQSSIDHCEGCSSKSKVWTGFSL